MLEHVVAVDGLKSHKDLIESSQEIRRLAERAVNKIARDARAKAGKEIRSEVAFPARYLSGSDGKLKLFPSRAQQMKATIRGAFEARSLARFVQNPGAKKRGTLRVRVDAEGSAKPMPRAFLMGLKNGNRGLAIRLKPGEKLQGVRMSRKSWKGLTFLYGPSVDQVFRDVSKDMEPDVALKLEREFLRLMELKGFA